MTDNIAGQNIQYFIIKNNNSLNTNTMYSTLNNLKNQLPKNSILFAEFNDYYQMYIIDDEGNSKPVQYNITDTISNIQRNINNKFIEINNQITYTYSYMIDYVRNQKSYILNNITNDVISNINSETTNLTNRINKIEYDLKEVKYMYSYSYIDKSEFEERLSYFEENYNSLSDLYVDTNVKYKNLSSRLTILETLIYNQNSPENTPMQTITCSVNNGVVDGESSKSVQQGSKAVFTIIPAYGYTMNNAFIINGTSNGNIVTSNTVSDYDFDVYVNCVNSYTYTYTYNNTNTSNTYPVICEIIYGNVKSISQTKYAYENTQVSFIIDPLDGYDTDNAEVKTNNATINNGIITSDIVRSKMNIRVECPKI